VCNYTGKKQLVANSPARMDRIREESEAHGISRERGERRRETTLFIAHLKCERFFSDAEEILIASKQSYVAF
jgi:hypothetical protein